MGEAFVSSWEDRIAAMIQQLYPRNPVSFPSLASVAARANDTVPVDGGSLTAGEFAKGAAAAGLDVDAVEHLRQDRIRRWQTPPNPTRKAGPAR